MMGKTISYYGILDKLGAGGLGVVSKAEETLRGQRSSNGAWYFLKGW